MGVDDLQGKESEEEEKRRSSASKLEFYPRDVACALSVTETVQIGMRSAQRLKVYPEAYFKDTPNGFIPRSHTHGHGCLFSVYSLCMSLQ